MASQPEPWSGYEKANVGVVLAEVAKLDGDPDELRAIEVWETRHKCRVAVLRAVWALLPPEWGDAPTTSLGWITAARDVRIGTPTLAHVYLALGTFSDAAGHVFPGEARLVADTGRNRREVVRAIELLSAFGYVERERRAPARGGRFGSNTYNLTWPPPHVPAVARGEDMTVLAAMCQHRHVDHVPTPAKPRADTDTWTTCQHRHAKDQKQKNHSEGPPVEGPDARPRAPRPAAKKPKGKPKTKPGPRRSLDTSTTAPPISCTPPEKGQKGPRASTGTWTLDDVRQLVADVPWPILAERTRDGGEVGLTDEELYCSLGFNIMPSNPVHLIEPAPDWYRGPMVYSPSREADREWRDIVKRAASALALLRRDVAHAA